MKPNAWVVMPIVIVALIVFFKYVFVYFAPFLIGILIALIIQPAIDGLEVKGCPRTLSSLVFVILTFGGIILTAGLGVVSLWGEIEQLLAGVHQLYAGTDQYLNQLLQYFPGLRAPILAITPTVHQSLNVALVKFLGDLFELIRLIPNALVFWVLAALTTFFASRDKLVIARFFRTSVPGSWHQKLFGLKKEMLQGLVAYIKAQVILMLISASLTIIGFLLVNQPYAWVLGILVGLLELLPIVGPSGVYIPVLIHNMLIGRPLPIIITGLLWLITFFLRQTWEPHIVGSQMGLHPLAILAAVYLGMNVLGTGGILLGPLLAISCQAIYLVFYADN